jgi:hypothetical protein
MIRGRRVSPFDARSSMGPLGQGHPHEPIPFAGLVRELVAGTFHVAGRHGTLGRQLASSANARHINAPLGRQQFRSLLVVPRNSIQHGGSPHQGGGHGGWLCLHGAFRLLGHSRRQSRGLPRPKGYQAADNLHTQGRNLFVQEVEMSQLGRQQPPVVVAHRTCPGRLELRGLAPETFFSQVGHCGQLRAPRDQDRKGNPLRDPHEISGRRGPLAIGPLQHPLHPVESAAALLHQVCVGARQIPCIALLGARNEARLQQAIRPLCDQPPCIGFGGLAPRHLLHVDHIDRRQLEGLFQNVVDRLPAFPRAFDGYRGDLRLRQPVGQRQQVVREGAKFLALYSLVSPLSRGIRGHPTCHDSLLMRIHSTYSYTWIAAPVEGYVSTEGEDDVDEC